jgi:hypothetical protein
LVHEVSWFDNKCRLGYSVAGVRGGFPRYSEVLGHCSLPGVLAAGRRRREPPFHGALLERGAERPRMRFARVPCDSSCPHGPKVITYTRSRWSLEESVSTCRRCSAPATRRTIPGAIETRDPVEAYIHPARVADWFSIEHHCDGGTS